jgi:radical SAM protein with 4Fe4S-binding SPASM domain
MAVSLIKKLRLLTGMLHGEVALTGPIYVDLDLTRRCNLKCLGCPYQNRELQLTVPQNEGLLDFPVARFKKLCRELTQLDVQEIILQGAGEPFLHPKHLTFVTLAKAAGLRVVQLTNGTKLDETRVRALLDSELDELKVSLWGSSATEYERHYTGSGEAIFAVVREGLQTVDRVRQEKGRAGTALVFSYILSRHNLSSVPAMIELAAELGADGIAFAPMHNFQNGRCKDALSEADAHRVHTVMDQAKLRIHALGLRHNVDTLMLRFAVGQAIWQTVPCYVPWFHLRIRTDGEVQPCGRCASQIEFGNLNTQSLAEIWNGSKIRTFRRTTLTRKGLASMLDSCDCSYCAFTGDLMKVHRFARWFAPIFRWRSTLE